MKEIQAFETAKFLFDKNATKPIFFQNVGPYLASY